MANYSAHSRGGYGPAVARDLPPPLLRRSISLPVLAVLVIVMVLLSIVALPVLVVIDLLTGAWRLRLARIYPFVICIMIGELVGTLAAGAIWIGTGFGLAMNQPWAVKANIAIQLWWVRWHLGGARVFAGMKLDIQNPELARVGNAIVMARHVSHFDALLPAHVYGNLGQRKLRYTLKAELQWSPALDTVGNRLPDVFVDRAPGPGSPVLLELEQLANGMTDDDVSVIFAEGTFFTPKRLERAVERISETHPDLATKASQLRYLLPPRPAGTLAMLKGAPGADVVVLGHVGLEAFSSISDIIRSVPMRNPVAVRLWRYPRAEVPVDDDTIMTWMLDRWLELDAWVADQHALRK